MNKPHEDVRDAVTDDIAALSEIWHAGWHDAHAVLVPEDLVAMRTSAEFVTRVGAELHAIRVVGPIGAPIGFCMRREAELYQVYVAPEGRGMGVAARLLSDFEAAVVASKATRAWLACAIGNTRAARFYEKHGWELAGEDDVELAGVDAPYPLTVWIYEKALG